MNQEKEKEFINDLLAVHGIDANLYCPYIPLGDYENISIDFECKNCGGPHGTKSSTCQWCKS